MACAGLVIPPAVLTWPQEEFVASDFHPASRRIDAATHDQRAREIRDQQGRARRGRNGSSLKPTRESKKAPSAESIARMADRGGDVSRFFTNRGKMMHSIQQVNVDFTAPMLQELDQVAAELNVSRQALDQHHLAQGARKAS
jgi:hypothetical protein